METTASIIAVLQLSGLIITYARTAHGAKDERQRLCAQLESCIHVLHSLNEDIDDSDAKSTWTETMRKLDTVNNPLHRLAEALLPVQQELSQNSNIAVRLKWPFRKTEIMEVIATIDREMNYFLVALSNDSGRLLHILHARSQRISEQLDQVASSIREKAKITSGQFSELKKGISSIQSVQNSTSIAIGRLHEQHEVKETIAQRKAILNWLPSSQEPVHQNLTMNIKNPATGSHILHSEAYETWCSTPGQSLFCPGLPGAGKTFIMSIIAQDLRDKYVDAGRAKMATLYCNYNYQQDQTLENLLASILKQLVYLEPTLPKAVIDLYEKHQDGQTKFILRHVRDALHVVIKALPQVFILIDALDECLVTQQLMETVFSLQNCGVVQILATSRFVPSIVQLVDTFQRLEIRASVEDVKTYLQSQMSHMPSFVTRNSTLQEQIRDAIVESADGMCVS